MKSVYPDFLKPDSFAIFLFHGVIPSQRHSVRNYTRKHLLVDHFCSILRELIQAGSPVSMKEIVEATKGSCTLTPNAFAITFDDGFANNFEVAAPILAEFNIPATFYVTTGFVESKIRSWPDLIEAALEESPSFELVGWGEEFDGRFESDKGKMALMDRVRNYAKSNADVDPTQFSFKLASAILSRDPQFDEMLDKKMSWNQVRNLASNSLFDVGGHSHTHRILSFLPLSEMLNEIDASIALLEEHLSIPIRHYSYPEGLAHCYSGQVIDALVDRGILCSPTAIQGVNRVGDDLFHLRRIFVV